MKLAVKQEQKDGLRRNEQKWSTTLMDAGWTALPSIILEKQDALGLDAIDVNILMQVARHWWFSDNPPHPSKATIARCIGISTSTVRRHVARMESERLIERVARRHPKTGGQDTNVYRFEGLIKEVTPYAEEAIAERTRRQAADQERRKRRRPRLVVTNSGTEDEKNRA